MKPLEERHTGCFVTVDSGEEEACRGAVADGVTLDGSPFHRRSDDV